MRHSKSILALLAILACVAPIQPSSFDFADASVQHKIKWPTKTIQIALSTSLSSPGPGIKPGSDVVGAVQRALKRWSSVANITFVEISSKVQSISPSSAGDGISLITIAETAENMAILEVGNSPARTRVFYDPETGEISEADIVVNSYPRSAGGASIRFSTDGTTGTYDLESTFTHELGHLLGLEHSAVIAATMQPRQAVNGVYNLPAFTERTLSEADRATVRSIYGPQEDLGVLEGRILSSSPEGVTIPASGAHVWAENLASGRVVASNIASPAGSFRIAGVPPGRYRVLAQDSNSSALVPDVESAGASYDSRQSQRAFRGAEIANQVRVRAGLTSNLNSVFVPPKSSPRILNPSSIGTNGELSTVPVLVEAGKKLTVYVGGDGVDNVPGSGISVVSPFMTVDPASLALQQFGTSYPVISFDVAVAANAPFGDYSIRLQSNSGDVAYLPGGITIDPGVDSALPNPDDDSRFFVSHHYRDFLGREPDQDGLNRWVNELEQCGSDLACVRRRRINVSAAFFIETEFQRKSSFVYGVYKSALGRRPHFSEFNSDRDQIPDMGTDREASRQAFALAFVQRSEFLKKYPVSMGPDQFVEALLSGILQNSGIDLSAERVSLLSLFDGSNTGRAAIIRRLAENSALTKAEYNKAFALMQYFGYLRRDPDEAGYDFWLNILSSRTAHDSGAYNAMVCAFLSSAEYQSRFGMLVTHTANECGP